MNDIYCAAIAWFRRMIFMIAKKMIFFKAPINLCAKSTEYDSSRIVLIEDAMLRIKCASPRSLADN